MHSQNRQAKRFRFRISTLLLVVLLGAACLAAWQTLVQPFQQQQRAAVYFREFGADVMCRPGGPRWARAFAGEDNLQIVTHITLPRTSSHVTVVDQVGVIIRPPDQHDVAMLRRHVINEQGFELLPALSHLTTLEIPATNLNDSRLKRLRSLTKLENLDISYTDVSDGGLRYLGELKSLRILKLEGLPVTDGALRHLSELGCIVSLSLSDTRVSNSGLRWVSELRGLSILELNATRVNDEGLQHLAALMGLERLSVKNTEVTDRGLSYLTSLEKLAYLEIRGSAVSPDGIAALRRQLPQLRTDLDDAGRRLDFFRKIRDDKQEFNDVDPF